MVSTLMVQFVDFMAKHYRHQDAKAQKGLLTNGVPSCLCGNFSGSSGLGTKVIETES
jgi:hypothetical protein